MTYPDFIVIFAYILIINIIGLKFSGSGNIKDYFLGNRNIHWLIACFSIVATETSTLTFLSVPGLAYCKGTGFLQIAAGYIIGRILISLILIPEFFSGKISTVYEYLNKQFGKHTRITASFTFHITRLLADSVRLFATSIPLTLLMGWDYRISLVVIGLSTLLYTYAGGIKAVAVADSLQFFLYIICVLCGFYFITEITQLSFLQIFKAIPENSFYMINTGFDSGFSGIFYSYNIFSGIIGGAFISFASHGTDHLMVQRMLACKNSLDAKKAVLMSGIIVFIQFAIFLLFGLFIKVMFNNKEFSQCDDIIPFFILNYIPAGFRGLMLAGIFAAAMSSLSSSINSLSASTAIDLINIDNKPYTDRKKIFLSRIVSLGWTAVIILFSIFLFGSNNPMVEVGLSIASVTYGPMLGLFILCRYSSVITDADVISGMICGIFSAFLLYCFTDIFWPWFVVAGFFTTCITAIIINKTMHLSKTADLT